VYVSQEAGFFERRKITLGRYGDSLVEVLNGLKEGEKVVTQGLLLMDGQAEMNQVFSSQPSPTGCKAKCSVDKTKG
jgi:Cu(I)/Ag(I) efflux system membrane fusion protein